MTNRLRPALVAIALAALAGSARADAQRRADTVIGLEVTDSLAATDSRVVATTRLHGPLVAGPTPVSRTVPASARHDAPVAAAQGRPRMPTSRALIIGGTAAALAGIVIGGDAGAIVAVTGTVGAVYGLYLHYR